MPPETHPQQRVFSRPSGRVERLLALRSFPGYAALPAGDVLVMAEHTKPITFAPGDLLATEGKRIQRIYFILRGSVALETPVPRILEGKSAVGGLAAFSQEPSPYSIRALERVDALEISVDDMFDIYEDNFRLLRATIEGISGYMIALRRQRGSAAGFSNELKPQPPKHDKPRDLVERMAVLHETMKFAESYVEALADMARELTEVRLPAGTVLWNEGDPGVFMYFLIGGVIRCTSSTGQDFVLGPGDSLGAIDLLAGIDHWTTAVVEEDLSALRHGREAMFDILEDHYEMARDSLVSLSAGTLQLLNTVAPTEPSS